MEAENDIRKIDPKKLARLLQWADDPDSVDIVSTDDDSSTDTPVAPKKESP